MPDTPGAKFQAVLSELDIVRVICIDDVYDSRVDIEGILVWGMLQTNRQPMDGMLKALGQDLDLSSETANAELRTLLEVHPSIAIELQAKIDRHRLKKDGTTSLNDEDKQLLTDRSVLSRLDEIMIGFADFQRLTPAQWQTLKTDLLRSLTDTSTLFIFDENLGQGVPSGTEHIREIAESVHGERASFGLLSYTIVSGTEHERTRHLQEQNIAATAISKRDLSSEKGIEQLQVRLRAAVLWKESKNLREQCKIALKTACTDAYDRVHKLTPLEFDEVIFRSSYEEGVHEMDTLVRVYTNAFATALRENLRSNVTALNHIDKLRDFRGAQGVAVSHGSTAWKLQRDEYYEAGSYINSCKMPPEAGDIYQITTQDGNTNEYVLIAPPCDLMIRNISGDRKKGVYSAILCPISLSKPAENKLKETFQLDYYSNDDGSSAWVIFSEGLTIDLFSLDLCAIDSTGKAIRLLNNDIPDHLPDGWKKKCQNDLIPKCDNLLKSWKSWVSLRKNTREGIGVRPAHGISLSNQSQVKVSVKRTRRGPTLEISIRRVQRLAPILSGELIRTYSEYIARPARPHSLSMDSAVGS